MQQFLHALSIAATLSCLCWPCRGQGVTCQPVTCTNRCEFGYQYDENDCQTCSCYPNPCRNHKCPAGEVCKVERVQCVRAPCYPVAVCSTPPPPCLGTTGAACRPTVKSPCVDTASCIRGEVWDPRLCKCVISPCASTLCLVGSECKVVTPPLCRSPPCSPIGVCIPRVKPGSCPAIVNGTVGSCATVCSTDADCGTGRRKCCSTACGGRNCRSPVYRRCPTTRPCYIRCAYGLKYDRKCCQLCQCRANPCTNYRCPRPHQVCLPVLDNAATYCDPPFKPYCTLPDAK